MTSTLAETSWWVADDHVAELKDYLRAYQPVRTWHLIDLFGYSGAMSRIWRMKGFFAVQYDVLLGGRRDDILTKRGFMHLLRSFAQQDLGNFLCFSWGEHMLWDIAGLHGITF